MPNGLELKALAFLAQRDARTIMACYRGRPVRPVSRAAIEAAARRLDLPPPPPAPLAVEGAA